MPMCAVNHATPQRGYGVSRLLLGMVISLCLSSAALSPPAQAGTINVWGCHQPNGQTAPLDHWSSTITYAGINAYNDCANTGVFSVTAQTQGYPGHQWGAWTFTAPSGTTVQSFRYTHMASLSGQASFLLFSGPGQTWDSNHIKEACGTGAGCEQVNWTSTTVPMSDESGLQVFLETCYLDAGCSSTGGFFMVSSAEVTLSDGAPPMFSNLSGNLTSNSSLAGIAKLSFQVTDAGTGVYMIHGTVDGASFDDRVLDTNEGRCKAVSGQHDFIYAVPCRPNLSASTSLDTTTLRDGVHNVRVVVEDAAGNQTTVFNEDVTTQNIPPSTFEPAPESTPAPGTSSPGSSSTSSETTTTASTTTGTTAGSTKRSGRAGKSRIVLKIAPRRTRNKHTIHLRGRLIGGPLPRHGVTLLAQARRKKTDWIVFRQIGVSGSGKFGFNYRFHSTTQATTYTFRIVLANESRRSARRTVSNSVKVQVKP